MPPIDAADDCHSSALRDLAMRKETLVLEMPRFQRHGHCLLPNIRLDLRYHCVIMIPRFGTVQARFHAAGKLNNIGGTRHLLAQTRLELRPTNLRLIMRTGFRHDQLVIGAFHVDTTQLVQKRLQTTITYWLLVPSQQEAHARRAF